MQNLAKPTQISAILSSLSRFSFIAIERAINMENCILYTLCAFTNAEKMHTDWNFMGDKMILT